LYVEFLEVGNGGPIAHKEFVKKYKFCLKGMSPKHVQVPRDLMTMEVVKYFGLVPIIMVIVMFFVRTLCS
jgi:hypothetical protein